MKVRILKEGKYQDENLKAVKCLKGAVLEVKGWYGAELIEQGLAILADALSPEEEAAEKKKVAAEKKKVAAEKKKAAPQPPKGGKKDGAVNPGEVFLG